MLLTRSLIVGIVSFLLVNPRVGAEAKIGAKDGVNSFTLERLKCFQEKGYSLEDAIRELEKSAYDKDQETPNFQLNEAELLDMQLAPRPGGGQPGVC
jgi:hypothetical protein